MMDKLGWNRGKEPVKGFRPDRYETKKPRILKGAALLSCGEFSFFSFFAAD